MKKNLLLFLFLSIIGFQNNIAQTAPKIHYNTPNIFTKGDQIIPLILTNTGGNVTDKVSVTTFAGSGISGSADGIGSQASFKYPVGMTIDLKGNLYIVDRDNFTIRKISPSGSVSTFAGSGEIGSTDALGINASFNAPYGITTDPNGNIYVADTGNHKIRKITPAGRVSTFAGTGLKGLEDGAAQKASFNTPQGIASDNQGNIFVADTENHLIRKITPEGIVSTIAGSGQPGAKDAVGINASFNSPQGITVDSKNNIFISDTENHKIRKITPAGTVSTFAGNGQPGSNEGAGNNASFYSPRGIAIDALENIYIADRNNLKIRKISPSAIVSTFAGSGQPGTTDGTGDTATFIYPSGIAVDATGQLYASDLGSIRVRKITYGRYNIKPTLPIGLEFNIIDGMISGTPKETSPINTYTVSATNGFGESNFDINITIKDKSPNISYTTPNIFTTNKEIQPLKPINKGGEILLFTLQPNLPSGLSFNNSTGEITGIPNTIENQQSYTITAYNDGGFSIFNLAISVIDDKQSNELQISEAITPNGDGINDTWMIYNTNDYTEINVKVFNRWGNEVYHSINYNNDWDGGNLPESAYYYIATFKNDIKIEKKGWLYITK